MKFAKSNKSFSTFYITVADRLDADSLNFLPGTQEVPHQPAFLPLGSGGMRLCSVQENVCRSDSGLFLDEQQNILHNLLDHFFPSSVVGSYRF